MYMVSVVSCSTLLIRNITEAENLGGQGGLEPPPPLFDKGGLSPPKLEVVTKNILNINSLFRIK